MAQFFFDSASAPQNVNSIPEGQYKMVIKSAEEKATKDGMGSYLNFRFEVIEGQHTGFSFFEMVTFNLPSKPHAQDIGRATLRQLVIAMYGSEKQIADLAQFCGYPLLVSTKNQPDQMTGSLKTRCKGFAPIVVSMPTQPQFGAYAAPQQPQQQFAQQAPQQYAQPQQQMPAQQQFAQQPQYAQQQPQYQQPPQQYVQPQYAQPQAPQQSQYAPQQRQQDVPF